MSLGKASGIVGCVVISITLLLFAVGSELVAAETISVVIPAGKPSRPAHFNWQFRSANGAAVQTGQFACGSYWVAPAAGDSGVSMVSLTGNPEWGDDLLSCDADPWTEKMGLLSSKKTYGNYSADENVLPRLPMTFTPKAGSCISLVAAMQRNEEKTSKGGTKAIVGNVADAYCVVTVLPEAPKDSGRNHIRPNITGATKELLTWDDFDLTRLPRYDFFPARAAKSWASAAVRWRNSSEVFGISCKVGKPRRGSKEPTFRSFSEGGRAFRAHLLVHNYASGTARAYDSDVLSLFSAENKLEEMKPALAAMLAYGLDIYHARYDNGDQAPRRWASGAGQWSGQYVPPVLLAALLKDETKAHRIRQTAIFNHGKNRALHGPQEMRQIRRGNSGVLLWGDSHLPYQDSRTKMGGTDWRYWADFGASRCYDGYAGKKKPNPNCGKKTMCDPYGFVDGPANKPGSSYMGVSFGAVRGLAAIMLLMPQVRSVVNTDEPIEYVDRIVRHGLWTWPDPVAIPPMPDQDTASLWWSAKNAPGWGKTYGPRPDDIRFAVENGKGRFKSLHGTKVGMGYEVGLAAKHWDKIISRYDGLTFEDNLVDLDTVVAPEIRFATGEKPLAYLLCATPDAQIHYTLDGSTPTTASQIYKETPLAVDAKTVVKALATHKEKKPSAIRSGRLPAPLR